MSWPAQDGDTAAARVLMERALPSVKRWARGRLPRYARSDADTEDVVQDAFLGTFRNLKRFRHYTVGAIPRRTVVTLPETALRLPAPADRPAVRALRA
jgi:hypothetical protein